MSITLERKLSRFRTMRNRGNSRRISATNASDCDVGSTAGVCGMGRSRVVLSELGSGRERPPRDQLARAERFAPFELCAHDLESDITTRHEHRIGISYQYRAR